MWGTSDLLRYVILKIKISIWFRTFYTATQCHVHIKRECGLRQISWHFNWILMKASSVTSGDAKPKYSQSHVPPAKLQEREKKRDFVSMSETVMRNFNRIWLISCVRSVALTRLYLTCVWGPQESHWEPPLWRLKPRTPASSAAPDMLRGWSCGTVSADKAG